MLIAYMQIEVEYTLPTGDVARLTARSVACATSLPIMAR